MFNHGSVTRAQISASLFVERASFFSGIRIQEHLFIEINIEDLFKAKVSINEYFLCM